jgi:hypothetical protein
LAFALCPVAIGTDLPAGGKLKRSGPRERTPATGLKHCLQLMSHPMKLFVGIPSMIRGSETSGELSNDKSPSLPTLITRKSCRPVSFHVVITVTLVTEWRPMTRRSTLTAATANDRRRMARPGIPAPVRPPWTLVIQPCREHQPGISSRDQPHGALNHCETPVGEGPAGWRDL